MVIGSGIGFAGQFRRAVDSSGKGRVAFIHRDPQGRPVDFRARNVDEPCDARGPGRRESPQRTKGIDLMVFFW